MVNLANFSPIVGFDGTYLISTSGEIWSVPKGTSNPNGKFLSMQQDKDGYYKVGLVAPDGTRKSYIVHRLIALTYLDNPDNKPQVNHIDGNKQNNTISNLEWVTLSENRQHAYDTKLQKPTQGILRKDNTSGYIGVGYVKSSNSWTANIQSGYTNYSLGHYGCALDAAKAYDAKAKELFGVLARLNIKEVP
jgi:hypothetical protein